GRDPRAGHRGGPRRRFVRARGIARSRRIRRGGRGVRHEHDPRSDGRDLARLSRGRKAGAAQHRRREAGPDHAPPAGGLPALRRAHAPAMTTRRTFLAWAAAALSACARAVRREPQEAEPAKTPAPPATAAETATSTPTETATSPEAPDLFAGAPSADDPLELLYSRRLSFEEGQPLVTVRVAEGRREMV